MDWRQVLFALEEGIPGLVAIVLCIPVFAFCAASDRKLWAVSPLLVSLLVFGVASFLAGIPNIETSPIAGYFPLAGFLVAVGLVAPSVLALRWRWIGILHLITIVAVVYLWFVASLSISHDGT